jgi:hypothetical protein
MAKEDDKDKDGKGGGALSDEAREEIGRTVNAAVTAQLSRKLPDAIKAGVEGAMSPILERLDAIGGKAGKGKAKADEDDADDEDDAPPKGKGKGGKAKESDELVQMRTRLKAIEDERVKEREAAVITKRDGELTSLLTTTAKVDPLRVKGALAVVAGNLKKLEDGSHVWIAQREGYTEDIPIAQGIAEWAKTDEGKAYAAAQQRTGGAGTRVVTGQAPGGTRGAPQRDPKAEKVERKEAAVNKLFEQVGGILDNGGGGE